MPAHGFDGQTVGPIRARDVDVQDPLERRLPCLYNPSSTNVLAQQEQERRWRVDATAQLGAGQMNARVPRIRTENQISSLLLCVHLEPNGKVVYLDDLLNTPAG